MLKLEEKIRDKSATLGVVGLGYVGLPLAVAFSEAGFQVLGIDIQQKRVDAVNQGQPYIADVSDERLQAVIANNRLQATTEQGKLKETDAICICVPTPLTKTKDPDLTYVIRESKEISQCLQPGQLIILESTTYPGTTREVVLPILESSELRGGIDFYLYYSLSLHLQQVYEPLGYKPGDFPQSEKAQEEVLSLPIYPELSEEQIEGVAEAIKTEAEIEARVEL